MKNLDSPKSELMKKNLCDVPKADLIKTLRINETDTASPALQIALFKKRVDTISAHLIANKKDKHSYRGLRKLLGKMRKMQSYLARKQDRHQTSELKVA